MRLALMAHPSLPIMYWEYSFTTSVFLINSLPTAFHKFTLPYHALFKCIHDYQTLRNIGCTCFPHLRPYN